MVYIFRQYNVQITSLRKQGKSEGFDSCDQRNNLTQIGFKSSIFQPMWPWNSMDDLGKHQGASSILHQALRIISNPSVNLNWSCSPETLNSGRNWRYFVLCDLGIWWMTLENNRAPLLYYINLCASFQSHGLIQTYNEYSYCRIHHRTAIRLTEPMSWFQIRRGVKIWEL